MPKTTDTVNRVTIMGLGLFGGGLGVAEYWAKRANEVVITDLRDSQTLSPSIDKLKNFSNITYVLGDHREQDFTNTDLIVVNPAVKPDNSFIRLAKKAGVPLTTEIGTFITEFRNDPTSRILAVTGSNGKSTTTSLLASIITKISPETLCGGNIGGSLLSQAGAYPAGVPAILELSSFQLHYLAEQNFSPDISVITNLSPNHIDWHITLENYYNDKKEILTSQNENNYAIMDYADPVLRNWEKETAAQVFFTSISDSGLPNAAFIRDDQFFIRYQGKEEALSPVCALKLPGRHNQSNALQALTAAFLYIKTNSLTGQQIRLSSGLSSFSGLPHRQEVVAQTGQKRYINDSIATTPQSTIAALNSYATEDIVIIAGGYDKKISLDEMSKEITQKAKAAVLIGQTGSTIATQIRDYAADFDLTVIPEQATFEEAVITADKKIAEGIILLSPGCASYGMFANFQERGESFKKIILQLTEK